MHHRPDKQSILVTGVSIPVLILIVLNTESYGTMLTLFLTPSVWGVATIQYYSLHQAKLAMKAGFILFEFALIFILLRGLQRA